MVVGRLRCVPLTETGPTAPQQDDWIEANWAREMWLVCRDSSFLRLCWQAVVVLVAMWHQSSLMMRVDVQSGRRFYRTPSRGHVTGEETFPILQMG